MKKILITGANSYIGTSVEKWLAKEPDKYKVDTVDMRDDAWREKDLFGFDVVFHVAAIVHKKEKPIMRELYFKVNRDLPIDVAIKAKKAGVKQFIFMSTMSVYGVVGKIEEEVVIAEETEPNPQTYYGKSKLEAENKLKKLIDEKFKVVILRPPMIYGPNCPGNYKRLENLAIKVPIFPMIENKRSMLHIDKLCQFVKEYIDNEVVGLYFPQDDDYINTSLLVNKIAEQYGKKVILSRSIGWMVKLIGKRIHMLNKVFGNLIYENDLK